jgi:hypothetical protein
LLGRLGQVIERPKPGHHSLVADRPLRHARTAEPSAPAALIVHAVPVTTSTMMAANMTSLMAW